MRGSIEAIGNQLLTCPTAAAGCTNARTGTGASTTMNNNYNMGYVDVDGDGTTVNSSTRDADAARGRDRRVGRPLLGRRHVGRHRRLGRARTPPTAARALQGRLGRLPDRLRGARRRAHLDRQGHALPRLRQRHARCRPRATPPTPSPTSRPAAATTASRAGRWSSPTRTRRRPMHRVSVYDGLGTVDATHTFSTNIAPFYTPASGTVATKTGLLAFEGDAGLRRDGDVQRHRAHRLDQHAQQPRELVDDRRRASTSAATTPRTTTLMGTDIDVFNNDRVSWPTTRARRRSPSPRPRTCSCRPRCGSSPTRARPSTRAARRIGGIARDGSTLTADAGTWNGTPTIDLRLPVAALRQRRRELRRHRRRHGLDLHARPPPTSADDPRRRHRDERRRLGDAGDLGRRPAPSRRPRRRNTALPDRLAARRATARR